MQKPKNVYQLKITLQRSSPPIWRRVLVPENIKLNELHEIIQAVMGWENYHLHSFTINDQLYGDPADDEEGILGTKDERQVALNKIASAKTKIEYLYDFGDSWEHTILVEKILPTDPEQRYPVCVAGKRACPPEDVGGVWGYAGFLEALADPEHEEHDEYLEWIGGEFDPEYFDVNATNRYLWGEEVDDDDNNEISAEEIAAAMERTRQWLESLTAAEIAYYENLPIRKNMLAFLNYLAQKPTKGIKANGHLPLKAVREISAQFVDQPGLQSASEALQGRVRNEQDVEALFFVHLLAFTANYVEGGPNQVWQLTEIGQNFTQASPALQIGAILTTWWYAYQWDSLLYIPNTLADMPAEFREATLDLFSEAPVGTAIPFKSFTKEWSRRTGLDTLVDNEDLFPTLLQGMLGAIIVQPLAALGILEFEAEIETHQDLQYATVTHITVTPFAKKLLDLCLRTRE